MPALKFLIYLAIVAQTLLIGFCGYQLVNGHSPMLQAILILANVVMMNVNFASLRRMRK